MPFVPNITVPSSIIKPAVPFELMLGLTGVRRKTAPAPVQKTARGTTNGSGEEAVPTSRGKPLWSTSRACVVANGTKSMGGGSIRSIGKRLSHRVAFFDSGVPVELDPAMKRPSWDI